MARKKEEFRTLKGTNGETIAVTIRRDRRLKKSARWQRQPDGSILLRIPYGMPRYNIDPLLNDVIKQLGTIKSKAKRRTDADLQQRAEMINRKYFEGQIKWEAIRWVGNMSQRLGSCTNGGSTDGHIRLSNKIRLWPDWVIDYIIAHELSHRVYPNHSKAFWSFLEAHYPLTERARGFIMGMGFADGQNYAEDEDIS